MYLLIFIPKNFVVTNCPSSPYHDGHAYWRGSALNAPGQVLVHADRDAEVVIAEADRVRRERERARGGGAAVVDVGERDAGEAQERDDGVGVVDLVAAAERELDVAPLDARVRERAADRDRAHLDARHAGEAAERVQPDAHDGDVHCVVLSSAAQPTGRNANVTTSLPSSSVRNGTTTSSISMPERQRVGIGLGEARLDLHLAGELDVADAERHERPCPSGPCTAATAAGSPAWSTPTAGPAGPAAARPSSSTRSAGTSPAAGT